MTDDCQTAVIVIAHTYTERTVAHIRTRTHTHEKCVWSVQSVVFLCASFLFLPRRILFVFFFISECFCSKKLCSRFFLFRHLKSSLLKPASFCRPIFDDAHKFTFLTHTRTRAPASIESAAKRDGIITAALAWNDQQVSNQI